MLIQQSSFSRSKALVGFRKYTGVPMAVLGWPMEFLCWPRECFSWHMKVLGCSLEVYAGSFKLTYESFLFVDYQV